MVLGAHVCDSLAVLFSQVGRSVLAFVGTSILYLDRGATRLSVLAIGQVPLHLPFPVVDNHFWPLAAASVVLIATDLLCSGLPGCLAVFCDLLTSCVLTNEPEFCLLRGCCLLRSCWLLDELGTSFRRLEWPSRPEPNDPARLRNWERFTESTRDFCDPGLLPSAVELVGSVTVLDPPDKRRTRFVGDASNPPALSDTLLLRLFAA